ncbi:MAG: MFS transporter, partial [Armatimonadota bacterium]|nr:MFS transporter [Armatimonadota bacterium]
LWYSLANLGYGMFYAFNNFIIPLWLQGYTQDARLLGIMGGSHSFEGVIIQPIVGSISDRLQGPGGRRRPFMRIFILLSALFLLLAPAAGHLPPPLRLVGVVVCIFLFTLTFNVAMDPYQALLADITTPEQRGRVTGFWFFVGALGQVIILLLPLDKTIKFPVVGLLMLATTWLTCFKTKEPLVTTPPETSRGHLDDIKLALAGLQTLHQARVYMIMFFLYGAGIGGVIPFLSLFIQHILRHPGMTVMQLEQIDTLAQRLPALLLILTAIGSIVFGWLTDKIGPKRLLMFSLLLIIAAAVNGLWVHTPLQIAFVLGLAGLGVGAQNASAYPLLTRIVPPKEIGFYVGLQTAAASLAGPGAVWLTGALINHSGYRVIFGVCAFCLLLAFVVLSFLREQETGEEIAARQAEITP